MQIQNVNKQNYLQRLLKVFDQMSKNSQSPKKVKQIASHQYEISIPSRKQRQFSLNKQFPMQKKGKNFGTEQLRKFRLEIGSEVKLLQLGGKEQNKQLPVPSQLTKEFMDQNRYNKQHKWNQKYKDFRFRLMIQFHQRNAIWVYFTALEHCNQILLCISKQIQQKKNINFKKAIKIFDNKVKDAFLMKMLSKNRYRRSMQEKRKFSSTQLAHLFIKAFNDQSCVKNMGYKWHNKTIFPSSKYQRKCTFQFQKVVTNLRQDLSNGVLKFWLKGQVPWRMKTFFYSQKNSLSQYTFVPLQQSQQAQNNHLECTIFTGCTMNFQFQNQEIGNFKSQRFNLVDLLKKRQNDATQCSILLLKGNKSLLLYLSILFMSQIKQTIKISQQITPIHYPVINQVYLHNFSAQRQLSVKEENTTKSISETINLHHLEMKYDIQTQSKTQMNLFSTFHSAYRLFDKLNIQALINKFYQSYPFSQYIMVDNKGSFVYKYFVEKSSDLQYYDVQRIIWLENKHSDHFKSKHNKRLLNAIKCFDQNPRIIFTNSFAETVAKNLQLAQCLTSEKWIIGIFQQSLFGIQSLAFFLTISLLKLGSQIFIRQPVIRRSLQSDSLLFHFTLKNAMPKVYYKISATQINIQALFGQQLVSFFAQILPLPLYQLVISAFIEQKQMKKQQSQRIIKTGQKQDEENYCLIGTFLAIIQIATHYQSAFNSPQSLIIFLKYYFKLLPVEQNLSFKHLFPIKIELVRQCANYSNFLDLKSSMQEFYQQSLVESQYGNNACSRQLLQIAYQLYMQFTYCKPKNQADLRKIFLIIDKIQIPQVGSIQKSFAKQNFTLNNSINYNNTRQKPKRLILQIFQKNQRLYSHQFQSTDFSKIHHPIEFKLLKLDPLIVSLHYESHHETYSFKVNPRVLPSNYYLQISDQLQCSVTHIYDKKMYVCYQAYIKDSSEIEFLQNRIPQKYINNLIISGKQLNSTTNLLNSVSMSSSLSQSLKKSNSLNNLNNNAFLNQPTIKQDILFCNNFMRIFRMPQNNFNLIYSQLCWYGNHYLIPEQRVLQINMSTNYGNPYLSTGNLIANQNSINQLNHKQSNSYNFHVSLKNSTLVQQQIKILYEVIKYSRCVFGRGIMPHPSTQRSAIFGKYLLNRIVCDFQPKQGVSNFNSIPHDSAQSLSAYVLNNFTFRPNISFIQFYAKMLRNLPLIHYLTYQPMEHLLLPTIQFQIWYQVLNSQQKIVVLFSSKINKKQLYSFKTQFFQSQIDEAEACINYVQVLKQVQSMQFEYCQKNICFDQFLELLKLNILIRCKQIFRIKNKLEDQIARKQTNQSKYLKKNQLILKKYELPNYQTHQMFIYLIETREKLILQLKQIRIVNEYHQTKYQSSKQNAQIHDKRLKRKLANFFSSFGHINGRWASISILLKIQGFSNYFYIQQTETRKRYLLNEEDIIIGQQIYLINKNYNQNNLKHREQSFPTKEISKQANSAKNKQNIVVEIQKFLQSQIQRGNNNYSNQLF